jgi:hypothetical protein
VLYIQADPPHNKRTGGLFPQEGGRWIVSLSGAGGDYAPTDEKSFLEFAASLRSPLLYDAIRQAERLTPIFGFRDTANHRRHYERMPRWPEGFVVLGEDYRYEATQGPPVTLVTRTVNRYVSRVVKVANVDHHTCSRLLGVLSLTAEPRSLFRPGVLWRAVTTRARQLDGPDLPGQVCGKMSW